MNLKLKIYRRQAIPTRLPCGEVGCSKTYATHSGRSKHRKKCHGINSQSSPVQGEQSQGSLGSGRPGPNSSRPAPSEPGLGSPEVRLQVLTQSGEIYRGRTRLRLTDSGFPTGPPRFESTRLGQSITRVDQSETLESEPTGPSDDSMDPDWVPQ